MKKFILSLTLFLAPVILICIVVELLLYPIPSVYRSKRDYLKKYTDQVEVIFLGSSHALFGIDPQYMERPAFNLAHANQSIDYDLKLLEKYFSDSPSLKVIALPVSAFSLHYMLSLGKESWRVSRYDYFYGILDDGQWIKTPLEIMIDPPMETLKRLKRFYIKKEKSGICSPLGFGLDFSYDHRIDPGPGGPEAAKFHLKMVADGDFDQTMEYFNQLIQFAIDRDIKVLLYTPPAFDSYVAELKGSKMDSIIQTAQFVADQNDHVDYINLLAEPIFQKDDYYDSHHLNERGAEKLVVLLSSEIESMIIHESEK